MCLPSGAGEGLNTQRLESSRQALRVNYFYPDYLCPFYTDGYQSHYRTRELGM